MPHVTDASAIADDALHALVAALATHDPEQVLELFIRDGAVFGSDADEEAIGRDELRAFFTAICAGSDTISWTWEVKTAGTLGDVVWFVAPGTCVFTRADGSSITAADPYRISGVLRRTQGRWLFAVFNGSEPQVAT
ncbi:MAG: hypothetical protein QOE05_3089 [Actinomycetota bacterium]|jgi:uncharacterized protein (TIGR02246 family)|nr:hypothetical protein [Actinomycetota bacterium]